MYELTFDYYQGPLEKLLELIEERRLEITLVNLAQVTEGFFDYLEKLEKEKVSNDVIADFLTVASKLLLIKSKVVLPSIVLSKEEEEEIENLEERLKIYQEFKTAKIYLKKLWQNEPLMFSREFLSGERSFFYPPQNLTPNDLLNGVKLMINELEKIFRPVLQIKGEIINLKKKIEEIFAKLTKEPKNFNDLHQGEKKEIIILFLAILHLIKQELVEAHQEKNFAEMIIKKI